MKIRLALTTAALAAALAPAAAQGFPRVHYARFSATITGAQTTKWNSTSGTYTDCNGTSQTKGDGTEVLRFDSGKPEKIYVQVNPSGQMFWHFGTWSPLSIDNPLGLLADVKDTRHGKYTTSWTGGWCGHPAPETSPAKPDCGTRRGIAAIVVGPYGRRLQVSDVPIGLMKSFEDCPVSTPTGVDEEGFTDTFGRLSRKLVLSRAKRIVIEDGKVYHRHERTPGVNATSTTHFRLVLVRHGRR